MKSKNQIKSKPKKKEKESKEQKPSIPSLSLLDSSIKEVLNQLGYEKLTNVQEKMVKELLNINDNNKNIICKSPKNSGKILSFLLPLTNKIIENEKKDIIERYIIITGIKERVHELYSMSKELLRDINGKKVCVCVGGASRKKENIKLMEDDVKLIIAMPQRIVEYAKNDKKKKMVINNEVKMIIFDGIENMEKNGYLGQLKEVINFYGFENDMNKRNSDENKIVNNDINFIFYCQNDDNDINEEDQINNKSYIDDLINYSQRQYTTITIKENTKALNSNNNESNLTSKKQLITKRGYIILDPSKKFLFLLTFLRKNLHNKILIFFATSKEVIFYNSLLNLYHIETSTILSNKSIKDNKQTLLNFINKEKGGFLLSTNLSKMKLEIPLCDWILFYDCPEDIQTFEENLEINSNNKINDTKAFMILMPSEVDILKEKKEINISEFNLNVGNIDKDQEKVEKMVNTKQQEVLVYAFDAYKEFLFNYALRTNKEVFNLDNVDVTKLCKSFGFKFPPYINFSSLNKYENTNEKKNKKKNFLFPDEIEKIYGKNE